MKCIAWLLLLSLGACSATSKDFEEFPSNDGLADGVCVDGRCLEGLVCNVETMTCEAPAEGEGEGGVVGEGEGEGEAPGEGEGEGPMCQADSDCEGRNPPIRCLGTWSCDALGEGNGPADHRDDDGCVYHCDGPDEDLCADFHYEVCEPDGAACSRPDDACVAQNCTSSACSCDDDTGDIRCLADCQLGVGVCGPAAPEIVDCPVRLQVRESGGMCPNGGCFQETELVGDHFLVFDDQTPDSPFRSIMAPAALRDLEALMAQVDPATLEDGYGPCCNAHFDGSDTYVTFFDAGVAGREVRISTRDDAPDALLELADALGAAGRALRDAAPADGPACVP